MVWRSWEWHHRRHNDFARWKQCFFLKLLTIRSSKLNYLNICNIHQKFTKYFRLMITIGMVLPKRNRFPFIVNDMLKGVIEKRTTKNFINRNRWDDPAIRRHITYHCTRDGIIFFDKSYFLLHNFRIQKNRFIFTINWFLIFFKNSLGKNFYPYISKKRIKTNGGNFLQLGTIFWFIALCYPLWSQILTIYALLRGRVNFFWITNSLSFFSFLQLKLKIWCE